MRQVLIQDDIRLVEKRLKTFEENTGCELLLVLARESDLYPGASFRFGIIGGFTLTLVLSFFIEFEHSYFWPFIMLVFTLFMIWLGHFRGLKQLVLSDVEVERESFEKAVECFHTLGTSRVSHKVTAMIFVSILERKIFVMVDELLKTKITQEELDELVSIMQTHFQKGNMALGYTASIESLEEKILRDFGGKVSEINPDELDDKLHFL